MNTIHHRYESCWVDNIFMWQFSFPKWHAGRNIFYFFNGGGLVREREVFRKSRTGRTLTSIDRSVSACEHSQRGLFFLPSHT